MAKDDLSPASPQDADRVTTVHPTRYFALACDYDGTIAHAGTVSESTLQALRKLKTSGRKLILVTGRFVGDLQQVFPHFSVFHRIVAENGAVLHLPDSGQTKLLADPLPASFIGALRNAGIPFDVGSCIVATCVPHDAVVLEVIRDLGLVLKVVYNNGSVLVLPSGVNKATGLMAALAGLCISPHNTVAVGDAENDHALLSSCAVAVALQNAIPTLKAEADLVTDQPEGAGVESLIEQILTSDLAELPDRRSFSSISLGTTAAGRELSVNSFTSSLLIAGPSASGKSTLVHSLLETMLERGFQVCLVDPEGDHEQAEGILSLGAPGRPPDLPEISKALESPTTSIAVNLLGLSIDERPPFFSALLTLLQEIRAKFGRPHWIIFDEAHHLMPSTRQPNPNYSALLNGIVLVTVHPEAISSMALKSINGVLAVGDAPENTLEKFRAAAGIAPAGPLHAKEPQKETGNVVAWFPYERDRDRQGPIALQVTPPTRELRRH
jgi:hydroxymethylpyrimidine pyrophosphatase-like HAD family hydrolase